MRVDEALLAAAAATETPRMLALLCFAVGVGEALLAGALPSNARCVLPSPGPAVRVGAAVGTPGSFLALPKETKQCPKGATLAILVGDLADATTARQAAPTLAVGGALTGGTSQKDS